MITHYWHRLQDQLLITNTLISTTMVIITGGKGLEISCFALRDGNQIEKFLDRYFLHTDLLFASYAFRKSWIPRAGLQRNKN